MKVGSPVLWSVPVLSEVHINAPHFEHATIEFSSSFDVEPLFENICYQLLNQSVFSILVLFQRTMSYKFTLYKIKFLIKVSFILFYIIKNNICPRCSKLHIPLFLKKNKLKLENIYFETIYFIFYFFVNVFYITVRELFFFFYKTLNVEKPFLTNLLYV